jgi:hypothetical protein
VSDTCDVVWRGVCLWCVVVCRVVVVVCSGSAKDILRVMAQPGPLDQFLILNPPEAFFFAKTMNIFDFHTFSG